MTAARASRRSVLLGASAVVLSGCTDDGPRRTTPSARPTRAQEATIFDLSLQETHRFRPFELVAPGFEVDVAGDPGDDGLVRAAEPPPAPFVAVELRLPEQPGDVSAGLATDDGDHVLVRWSARTSTLTLSVRRDGRTRVLRRRTLRLDGAAGLAFALCENQVTALVDAGEGWQPVLTERTKVASLVDLRQEDELARHRVAWSGDADEVRAGLFGMTGVRDPHLVQHADGSAYVRDGRIFLTWTCAGLGFFQQAHWTVWSMDPAAPEEMRLEAQLFTRRDGLVLGDHAGQLVRDGDRWLVGTSAWGDFAPGRVHVRHATTTSDLLTGVHVLDTEPTGLPTEHQSWDPAFTRLEGSWHVGFVESPSQDPFDFHPALARTSSADWTDGLSLVAAADSLHQCEGPIIATVEGETWLLASDGDDRNYPVFDLTGRRVGRLDAPYPTNIPHPQLVADPAGGWLMVTFDGTQFAEDVMGYGGHGDVVVLHSI
jgi:hypothetical protein